MTEGLHSRINEQLEKGYAEDIILQNLVNQGYKAQEVQDAISTVKQDRQSEQEYGSSAYSPSHRSFIRGIFSMHTFKILTIGLTVLLLLLQIITFQWSIITLLVIGGLFTSLARGRLFSMGFAISVFYLFIQILGLLLGGLLLVGAG